MKNYFILMFIFWYFPCFTVVNASTTAFADRTAYELNIFKNLENKLHSPDFEKEKIPSKLLSLLENSKTLIPTKNLLRIKRIRAVAFAGPSASGKSTLIKQIQTAFSQINIPTKFTSRKIRKSDADEDLQFVPLKSFQSLIERKLVNIYWTRVSRTNEITKYGYYYQDLPPNLTIFSSYPLEHCNARIKNSSVVGKDETLIIAVYAPDQDRAKRLRTRSPDMSADDVKDRLDESILDVLPCVDLIVKNYGVFEQDSLKEIIALVRLLNE